MQMRILLAASLSALLAGCVTSTVDEVLYKGPEADLSDGDALVVIMGRRHASDYETEPDFINCVGKHIQKRDESINVMSELEFMNQLYPWFEPRTAPLRPNDIERLMAVAPVREKLEQMNTEYMVWIDGETIRTGGAGSMTCGIGPGGAGCFGFGTWGNDSNYEATIWDFSDREEVGRMSMSATGQSYMPAVVVPIPIIAPVQGTACDGLGDQLLEFFSAEY
ncbi:MAG: hypothetical protein AAGI24_08220 [Pseudomonadota bacterium]